VEAISFNLIESKNTRQERGKPLAFPHGFLLTSVA
jgi:hypothetical protein